MSETEWKPIETAPKGGGADNVNDPAWVEPPRILLWVEQRHVLAYWDWYYAPGGNGHYEGCSGWIVDFASEELNLHFSDEPTHWMPLPQPPESN